ncbi:MULTISPECIES: HK97 gp10 family phage protein [unclassified Breznakia]|uniref:HK97 gp10 family phage protein n=1 Tax=unclassified Breznakia TaxID=2623764 RepID=UPI002473DCB5|nr:MULTISPECIES: HK97 gp10 family phage protein [unclassified Breznakia]MDH6367135.1 hypothetical protein [Breznakia sp. PH1-1]MDH6404278.1 hypothetical protein [Breznakia sp. PF1-11]MDH6412023.1 hypothetical protein [Breznakia sp. PFB1-11]MDH6414266.1 hypothetical protein [Breznakia sp. PFB1-14]MDH6416637.1 hypothetical protein [Breznakia sp. PFB1-4]
MKKVDLENFASEIASQLLNYSQDVADETKDAVDEITAEATKIVRENAPVSDTKRKGKYKRSIKNDKVHESTLDKEKIIYANGKEYRLTHLLEKGHLTRNGKRTKAHPHFEYGDEYIEKNFEKKLVSKVQKIK